MWNIDKANYFVNLPRDYYLSGERFAKERERIFSRQWIYVAHESQLPNSGDRLVCDLAGNESVIIARGEGGNINGFFNVCRHRGFRLCDSSSAKNGRIVCPYHGWTYDVEGRLRNATSMPDGKFFDYRDHGLKPVHVEVWRGFVFVNLCKEQPDKLGPRLDEVAPQMALLETERLKVAAYKVYELETNWKLLMENYLECSHCSSVHPKSLCRSMDISVIFDGSVHSVEPTEVGPLWIPLKDGAMSISLDGTYVSSKLLGEFGRGVSPPKGFSTGFIVTPAITGALFQSDYGIMHRVDAISPTKTRLHNWWYVREDAVEGVDYDAGKLVSVWDKTDKEDAAIVERQLRGVQSMGFEPGPHHMNNESLMRAGLLLYLQMMGEV